MIRKVFYKRAIFFISPPTFSPESIPDGKVVHFESKFFKNKFTYSKLLCSKDFYSTFAHFDFLQIVQLDCYVFEDRLDEFMKMGFDYIGAPWMKNGFEGKPEKKIWKVGNGGFSLRRINKFTSIIDQIHNSKKGKFPVFQNLNSGMFRSLKNRGFRNNLRHYIKNAPGEDIFWSIYIPQVFKENEFKIADPVTAAHYSFEVLPQFLFDDVTKGQLPMGCHNWMNNDPDFWAEHISV